ncbi:MAG TPA: DUF1614 domain-containing protein [Pirellulales bacterium]|nr:DUF1614 domain-containing protein [Pirellulales bacterium]
MHPSQYHYSPVAWPFFLILFIIFGLAIALIELNVIGYAYERIGVSRRYVFGLLLLSLAGSFVNIPIAELPPEKVESDRTIEFMGMRYNVPVVENWPGTIIAVNLGGAVIPTLLSIYLIIRNAIFLRSVIGVAIVALIVHWLAKPVPGVGIAVPIFIPPIAAALVAVLLARIPLPEAAAVSTPQAITVAPALAYVVGSLGTLIGADLMNLGQIQGLGAPIASIGGAGTFDGIFVTGIVAVLLA